MRSAAFFVSVAGRSVVVDELTADDLRRIAALVADYVDLPLGGTDASVIALAERHIATAIATLDRRHFSVVRLRPSQPRTLRPRHSHKVPDSPNLVSSTVVSK